MQYSSPGKPLLSPQGSGSFEQGFVEETTLPHCGSWPGVPAEVSAPAEAGAGVAGVVPIPITAGVEAGGTPAIGVVDGVADGEADVEEPAADPAGVPVAAGVGKAAVADGEGPTVGAVPTGTSMAPEQPASAVTKIA